MTDLTLDRARRTAGHERALLGSLMHAGADRDKVLTIVRPDDFSTDAHQTLAAAVRDLWAEGRPIELQIVIDRLRTTGGIGRLAADPRQAENWVADVFVDAGSGGLAEYLAGEVLDASRKRQLAGVARDILADCARPDGPAAELIDRAAARVFALGDRGAAGSRLRTSAEATNAAMTEYDRRARGEELPGVMTGLADLDLQTGGLAFGQLTVLAARPSVGKTAFSHQIARYAAAHGQPVLFASLEQRHVELGTRGIAAQARVCGQTLRTGGRLADDEKRRLPGSLDHLRSLPLTYDDTSAQTALHILGTARALKRKSGLALVVIDYLQLVASDQPKASRNDQLDVITKRVRDMARELNVAVLALSQLSRDCEKQQRRPRLSDLRDSGAIEQHTDAVFILHRAEDDSLALGLDRIEIGIEKQRNGPVGMVEALFDKKYLKFENMARS